MGWLVLDSIQYWPAHFLLVFVLQSYHVGVYGAVIMIPLNALLQILVIFGGIAVVRAKGRGMAMTGAVLSVIPCLSSSLCMLGIPFGIWSLIVLSDSNVKQLFR